MDSYQPGQNRMPALKGISYFLAHVPGMVRHGSKPSWEIEREPSLLNLILNHLQTFEQVIHYPPDQVFVGNLDPDDLLQMECAQCRNFILDALRWGAFGEMMSEGELYGVMKVCDKFQPLWFEETFLERLSSQMGKHPLFAGHELQKLGKGFWAKTIKVKLKRKDAIPLHVKGNSLIGCCQRARREGAEEDPKLDPRILLEILASRPSGGSGGLYAGSVSNVSE